MEGKMKPCKDCKWLEVRMFENRIYKICSRQIEKCHIDEITGEIEPPDGDYNWRLNPYFQRSRRLFADNCGIKARFFEPKVNNEQG
jgi:hypothetical protein